MHERRKFGNEGERLAREYLERHGYRIREAPWQCLPYGEIDIVAERQGTLVFVEVKTRRGNAFGYPEAAVTRQKRIKIARVIEIYLRDRMRAAVPYRFDVIAIEYGDGKPKLTHIEAVGLDG